MPQHIGRTITFALDFATTGAAGTGGVPTLLDYVRQLMREQFPALPACRGILPLPEDDVVSGGIRTCARA